MSTATTTAPRPALELVHSTDELPAGSFRCQDCKRVGRRAKAGPVPQFCPECRAQRNRAAAATRRRSGAAGRLTGRVAGSRNSSGADWQLPPEDHLAMRAARLRLAVNDVRLVLTAGTNSSNPHGLAAAVECALGIIDALPVGR